MMSFVKTLIISAIAVGVIAFSGCTTNEPVRSMNRGIGDEWDANHRVSDDWLNNDELDTDGIDADAGRYETRDGIVVDHGNHDGAIGNNYVANGRNTVHDDIIGDYDTNRTDVTRGRLGGATVNDNPANGANIAGGMHSGAVGSAF